MFDIANANTFSYVRNLHIQPAKEKPNSKNKKINLQIRA